MLHLCLQLREEPVPVVRVMSIPRVFHEGPAVVGPGCLHTKVTPSGYQVSLGTDQLCWAALGQVGHRGQPWSFVLLPQTQAVSQDCRGSGTEAAARTGLKAEKKEGKT